MTDSTGEVNRGKCGQCGADLPPQAPQGLCPKCLLRAGFADPARQPEPTAHVAACPELPRGTLQPGDHLGHYRIERPLGGGGMGMVFEAEDLESGRRVALKVLSQALDAPQSRERFFREGRLAASINHPNSVYVFGTEEIAGIPVIAMELVAGGTLEEQVRSHGPASPPAAVDAILQIIAGLEAAHNAGILHRDVKPSNCFRDADGTVKIGDFGLSISTAIRTEPALTCDGAFLGTPAFCSPEQLRGEELNARSDIYSVGATLFYLLTGRMPFEAQNVVALIAMILEQPTPSPRDRRPEVPRGLAKVVRRCLARQPAERFKTYDELRRALAPYSSAAPVPATLGLRFLAILLDYFLLGLVGLVLFLPGAGGPFGTPFGFLELLGDHPLRAFALAAACAMVSLSYFAVLEGFWGATLGKALCRLRVVDLANNPPGFWRALGRAAIYTVLPALPNWLVIGLNPKGYLSGPTLVQYLVMASAYLVWGLLFSTARRRNGFAAVHDLATGTRVVSRSAVLVRPLLPLSEILPAEVGTRATVGPYHVLETLEQTRQETWLLAYDLRLLRRVWLRTVPPGTPPVEAPLRRLGRVGRLRWLAGRRTPDENWDAFEAPSGKSLVELAQTRESWQVVRYWLSDLAGEIHLCKKDGTPLPNLALDRVWITGEGRAKLLDFPAPGSSRFNESAPVQGAEQPPVAQPVAVGSFLHAVAQASLEGNPRADLIHAPESAVPLPAHAREFLRKLPGLTDPDAVVQVLRSLLQRVAVVTRARRALMVAGCIAFPLLAACSMVLGARMQQQWNHSSAGIIDLNTVLATRQALHTWGKGQQQPTDRQFALYIAGHYRAAITNNAVWSGPIALALIKAEPRRFAEQSLDEQPVPTAAETADAETAVKAILSPGAGVMEFVRQPWFMFLVTLMVYVSLPAVLAALIFRGGLVLRIAGVTFARRDGMPASRLRLFWRALLTWAPFWVLGLVLSFAAVAHTQGWTNWLAAALACGLAALSVALPVRGLADRLAGTWPVAR